MPFESIGELEVFTYERFGRHVRVTNVVTTRRGGVSTGPYATLNVGRTTGDDPANVDANRARLSLLTSLPADDLTLSAQVHGRNVAVVESYDRGRRYEATDALVTDAPDIPLAIFVADCVPIAFHDPIKQVVGVAHAGWRGTLAGTAAATVDAMVHAYGTDPTDLVVGVGPSIGPCCYEVGEDVAGRYRTELAGVVDEVLAPGAGPGTWMLDLWRANVIQLVGAGVFEDSIATSGICTSCHSDRFYSHRKEHGVTGRFAALVMLHQRTKRSY